MAELLVNGNYKLKIASITNGAESFMSGTKQMYSHYITLADEQNVEFQCQICDTNRTFIYATKGDIIEISVTAFTKNRYSFKFVKLIQKDKYETPQAKSSNPIMRGTAAEVALSLAVELFKYVPETDTNNIPGRADKFFEWLCDKTRP